MNREEKMNYLNSYLELKREVDILAEEYHFWEETSRGIPISRLDASGVHGNRKKDKSVKYIDRHIEICNLIEKKQKEAEDRLKEILATINTLEDPRHRSVLKFRYISGYRYYDIAKEMHYNIDHVIRLHRDALNNMS